MRRKMIRRRPQRRIRRRQKKGSLIRVLKESTNIGDASSFLSGENVLVCNLFRFGGDWWQTGALLDPTYEDNKAQIEAERNIQKHKKSIHDYNLLKQNGYGDKFVFIEDVKTMKRIPEEYRFRTALPTSVSLRNTKRESSCTEVLIRASTSASEPPIASLRLKTHTTMPSVQQRTVSISSPATVFLSLTRLFAS